MELGEGDRKRREYLNAVYVFGLALIVICLLTLWIYIIDRKLIIAMTLPLGMFFILWIMAIWDYRRTTYRQPTASEVLKILTE